jgi:hypothetical protein
MIPCLRLVGSECKLGQYLLGLYGLAPALKSDLVEGIFSSLADDLFFSTGCNFFTQLLWDSYNERNSSGR